MEGRVLGILPTASVIWEGNVASVNTRILIVNPDPDILRQASDLLVAEGYGVRIADGGMGALMKAFENPPDLLITAIDMPEMDGWGLVTNLRTQGETALIPVIFLTNHEDEEKSLRGFKSGADEFLLKDRIASDLIASVKHVIHRGSEVLEETRQITRARHPMMGQLHHVSLASVLVLLEMELKTGELLLRREDETARLLLKNGRIMRAWTDGDADLRGENCVYHVLEWKDGEFVFRTMTPPGIVEMNVPMSQLLLEAARRMDTNRRDQGPQEAEGA